MEKVAKYVNDKFRSAGNSREAQGQKEELIADLRDRIRDAMALGKTEDEAFNEAVAAMDGMDELTSALDGKRRTVYANRLNFHHSLLVSAAIALEILACAVYQWLKLLPLFKDQMLSAQAGSDRYFNTPAATAVFIGLAILLLAAAVYPVAVGMICKTNPGNAQSLSFDFRKKLMVAVLGWLALSSFFAAVNFLFPTYSEFDINNLVDAFIYPYPANLSIVNWFIWPLIGLSNWPLSMVFYGLLFKRKRYAAG